MKGTEGQPIIDMSMKPRDRRCGMKDTLKLIQDAYTSIQLVEEAVFGIKQGYELENANYISEEDRKIITGIESTRLIHAVSLLKINTDKLTANRK